MTMKFDDRLRACKATVTRVLKERGHEDANDLARDFLASAMLAKNIWFESNQEPLDSRQNMELAMTKLRSLLREMGPW